MYVALLVTAGGIVFVTVVLVLVSLSDSPYWYGKTHMSVKPRVEKHPSYMDGELRDPTIADIQDEKFDRFRFIQLLRKITKSAKRKADKDERPG